MRQLGISFDTIIHPELLKLVLFRHAWVQPTEEVESRDTAAMMIVVLPSQLKVDFRVNPLVLVLGEQSCFHSLLPLC